MIPLLSSESRRLLSTALPASLRSLSMILMGLIDAAIVGHLGAAQLASVSLVNVWLPLVTVFPFVLAGVTQQLVAMANGAHQPEKCGAMVWNGLWASLPLACVVTVALTLWNDELARWAASSDSLAYAADYLAITVLATPVVCVTIAIASFFSGLRDTRTPMIATLVAHLVKASSSATLAFGWFGLPALGVRGAAIGTVIASTTSCLLLLAPFLSQPIRTKYQTHRPSFDRPTLRAFAAIGGPLCFRDLSQTISVSIFFGAVTLLGSVEVATTTIVSRLQGVGGAVLGGLAVAAVTEAAAAAGARNVSDLQRTAWCAVKWGTVVSLLVFLVLIVWRSTWVGMMTSDPAVQNLAPAVLVFAALGGIPWGVVFALRATLNGIGATRVTFVIDTAATWLLWLPLCFILMFDFKMGVAGAFLAGIVWHCFELAAYAAYFWGARWRDHVLPAQGLPADSRST